MGNTSSYEYTYDEKGNLIKRVDTNGEYADVYEYAYDDAGNKIRETSVSAWGAKDVAEITVRLVYIPYDVSDLPLSYYN